MALLLAGCAGADEVGPPAQRVSAWMSGGAGGSAIGELEVDNRNVDLAISLHDQPGALKTVCDLLVDDAATANGNLPTPDQKLTYDLADAYTQEFDAGTDCANGAGGNRRLLARSAKERAAGQALLAKAVARVTRITGAVPSTTTTTLPPGSGFDPFGG